MGSRALPSALTAKSSPDFSSQAAAAHQSRVYLAFRKEGQMNQEEKLEAMGCWGCAGGVKKGTLSVPSKFFKVGGSFESHHFLRPKSYNVKTLK